MKIECNHVHVHCVLLLTQLADIPPQELGLHQREDAVASLEYEAQARVQDPVYGCVGILCVLQVCSSTLWLLHSLIV